MPMGKFWSVLCASNIRAASASDSAVQIFCESWFLKNVSFIYQVASDILFLPTYYLFPSNMWEERLSTFRDSMIPAFFNLLRYGFRRELTVSHILAGPCYRFPLRCPGAESQLET